MDAAADIPVPAETRHEMEGNDVGIAASAFLRYRETPTFPATSIDLLDISEHSTPHTYWYERLDDDSLQQRLSAVNPPDFLILDTLKLTSIGH